MLHQAWQNDDAVSRKAYIMSWTAAAVPGFLETSRISAMREYHAKLRLSLARHLPQRAHIVPTEFAHGVSEYGHKPGGEHWDEMLLPDEDGAPSAARL